MVVWRLGLPTEVASAGITLPLIVSKNCHQQLGATAAYASASSVVLMKLLLAPVLLVIYARL
jgi:hypothetical protein